MTSVWGTLIGVACDGGFDGGWEEEDEERDALGRLPFWKIDVDSNEGGNKPFWSMIF